MSKLYEALQNAQVRTAELRPPPASRALANDPQILRLYQAVEKQLGGGPKIIQVAACGGGEGASTVAGRLARLAAGPMGKRTLLIDAANSHRNQRLAMAPLAGQAGGQVVRLSEPSADDPLTTSTLVEQVGAPTGAMPTVEQVKSAWKRLRAEYDLIVVDSLPAMTPSAVALAPCADGVLLVVEAEKTAEADALAARDALAASGATLLGVVFNKRRRYLPKALERL